MTDLSLFGTEAHPLRPSQLDQLNRCVLRGALLFMGEIRDESGPAADTGSLVHAGVAAFHLSDEVQAGLDAMSSALPKFPLADLDDATRSYGFYARDPRNKGAKVVKLECPVRAVLPCHPSDKSGRPVVVAGTLDQVRESRGRWSVWDLKTGKESGWDYIHEHALQQSAYCIAATQTFGREVHPGGLICSYGYRRRNAEEPESEPSGVFFAIPWTLEECYMVIEGALERVARIREGALVPGPGKHCGFCPARGLSGCLEKLSRLT